MTAQSGTLFFLPGLGFGADASAPLALALEALGAPLRVVGIDLPGQNRAPDADDGSVSALADAAVAAIEAEADGGPWMLVAHSLGGKVAALVAARVLRGEAQVFGLMGSVLLAPSPPTPEPMSEDKRALMLSWAENGRLSEADAREFVAQNVASPLGKTAETEAIAQVRQLSPVAWRQWLRVGSREDVSNSVGVIDLPVVVLGGEDDSDLGASAQPGLLSEVYPRARFVSLAATGHLLPYERPREVAEEIVALWQATVAVSPAVSAEWGRLIASERTRGEARSLLARRAIADDAGYAPRALSPAHLATLRALADRLVPQPGARRIDLAGRVDADLALGCGDGWRPSGLPGDAAAYRLGLDALSSIWPPAASEQIALIEQIIAGESVAGAPWGDEVFSQWFEDVRTDLVRAWLAHPASLARVGYDGFATSGSAVGPAGYATLGADERDPWEPTELGVPARETENRS